MQSNTNPRFGLKFSVRLFLPLFLCLSAIDSPALILFNESNDANQSDPGTGVPWDSVGRVQNSGGTLYSGTAVYLGDGWVLTANHVTTNATYSSVTFNGTDSYSLDLSTIAQVAANVDLKVIRLTLNPGITPVTLLPTSSELVADATIVGWGKGRDPSVPLGNATVAWGSDSTSAKRWGINVPKFLATIPYQSGNYTSIGTYAGGNDGAGLVYNPDGVGDDEAALTLYDSGSAIFQLLSGDWYLIGIGTTVQTLNTTTFGNDASGGGNANYFARISAYDTNIAALIPEPSTCALLAAGGVLLAHRFGRRRLRS